ncbi:hypothetical protein PGT21_009637 [Puccinia graminis f. sp. tritici]|uniref:Uncharacterized protein n=2 Tax=Puccinia graminis f. sp. tritici TaxID=56615 RepID=E3JWK9_PUCGT|nr:uncharacterized protein PGTG_02875 [Puccinia graminis f. sp. tritici CRL 75-36-700-3]EFP76434.2 hypothetical protein PGTG_02875 [Puccinia graminis f. sp. tritici CRL 75-36-700-3]KAA1079377.1 hypothetical protein PGT21_009637 [Puccinia graminis f. sp. tritici]
MEETLRNEALQAIDFLERHKRANTDKLYREALTQEPKKDRYVDTNSKVKSLKEMVARDLGFQGTVKHPRVWHLQTTDVGAPMKNHGTPPAPRRDTQVQVQLPRANHSAMLAFILLSYALLFFLLFSDWF